MWFGTLLLVLLHVCGSAMASDVNGTSTREKKSFGLFTVVQFKQDQCTAQSDSSMYGTCLTQSECNEVSGGAADGNCAAGFGVCCVATISTCGTTFSQNCTYLTNPGYPSGYSTAGSCAFTFSRASTKICQIRLDFDNFVLAAPTTSGSCAPTANDQFTVTSPTNQYYPVICGTNTGQHMYVETGSSGNLAVVTVGVGSGSTSRTWKIKATTIECGNDSRAPNSCLKYLTGITGTIQSYNRAGGQQIADQYHMTCIRQEEGYCSISWYATTFDLHGTIASVAGTGTDVCITNGVSIHNVITTYSYYSMCSDFFNQANTATAIGYVKSETLPFTVEYVTTNAIANLASTTGYKLRWQQGAC